MATTSTKDSKGISESIASATLLENEDKLLIVMVGLPARGKSYIARKVCRYLNWLQYPTKVFNVGEKRRRLVDENEDSALYQAGVLNNQCESSSHSAAFFDPTDANASQLRERLAMDVLDELLEYLRGEGKVGILDATNTTVERRQRVVDRAMAAQPRTKVLFVESQCFNQVVLASNINLKLSGPDYKHDEPISALLDFNNRISMYEKRYTPIGEIEEAKGYSYCQVIDVGRKTITYNINNPLSFQTSHFLQSFHLYPRQIWLTRHGESEDDVYGRLGGSSGLSSRGQRYAAALTKFISSRRSDWKDRASSHDWIDHSNSLSTVFEIWTSQLKKSVQTAQYFDGSFQQKHIRSLDELNAGDLDGQHRSAIPEQFTEWYKQRRSDEYNIRYPGIGGEAYHDLMQRLKSIVLDVEGTKNHVLLISGLAAIRILLAYFRGLPRGEVPHLDVPQGTVYLVEPQPYGVNIVQYRYNDDTDLFDEISNPAGKVSNNASAIKELRPSSNEIDIVASLHQSHHRMVAGEERFVRNVSAIVA